MKKIPLVISKTNKEILKDAQKFCKKNLKISWEVALSKLKNGDYRGTSAEVMLKGFDFLLNYEKENKSGT